MSIIPKNASKIENNFDISCTFSTVPVENSAFDDVIENVLL